MTKYTITSEEGAQRYGAEAGSDVDLDLNKDEERAVIAAGWLEAATKKKEEK